MGRNRRRNRDDFRRILIAVLLILMGCFILFMFVHQYMEPNIDGVCRLKARGMITEILNETVREKFSGEAYEKELFIIEKDNDGKILMVQSNTRLLNELASGFTETLQEKYDRIEAKKVKLKYGTLLGSKLLSQLDAGIKVRLLPLSVASCDFESEFQTQGINQTKYRIFIVVESNVKVLEPFTSDSFKVKNRILLSEVVILGDVPESYVSVPEEDLLDGK